MCRQVRKLLSDVQQSDLTDCRPVLALLIPDQQQWHLERWLYRL